MGQGIFGVVRFDEPLENRRELGACMGRALKGGLASDGALSELESPHFVLGMKRKLHRPWQEGRVRREPGSGVIAMMHGEVQNSRDLTGGEPDSDDDSKSDLLLAASLLRKHGVEFAKKLNGMFSIALVDEREKSVVLLNDRFGMAHQLYWTIRGGAFYFATHIKSLLECPGIDKEIDPEGLNLFLKYSYVPSPWTILRGIKKLSAGHCLVFRNGEVAEKPFWEFDSKGRKFSDIREAVEVYRNLLQKSIKKRLEDDADVGILLSGGLDSSANVAMAAQCSPRRIKTFSIGFEDEAFDERPYARIVADHFDTEHHEYTITGDEIEDLPKLVWHLEEPYFEFGLFLTYLGMASAKKDVDLVIGGEGADQLFGTGGFAGGLPVALRCLLARCHLLGAARHVGKVMRGGYFYNRDNLAFKLRLLLNRVTDLNDWYFYGYDQNELRLLHREPENAAVPRIFGNGFKETCRSFQDLFVRCQIEQDIKHYVNENVMVKSGRMADMLGLTLRESYLDVEVVDFLVSLPYEFKRSGDLLDHLKGKFKTKLLHRKAMEGLLPDEIMKKPKQGGFVPVMIFLKDQGLRRRIYDHLLKSEPIRQYFDVDYVNSIFLNYESVIGHDIYWPNFYNSKANRILFLLTFDIWHHFYIQNNPLDVKPQSLSQYILSVDK